MEKLTLGHAIKQMSKSDWRDEAVADHTQCCLCGQHLKFQHKTDFATLTVEEEAFCLSCQIRARKDQYRLQ